MSENLQNYFNHAKTCAKLAGDVLYAAFTSYHDAIDDKKLSLKVDIKDCNDANLVTVVDKEIQDFIISYLLKEFPMHSFIGEESEYAPLGKEPTWIIDPIDGTTNFVHGLPYCCVSIGLVIEKEPMIGVIYNPLLDQMFTACKGVGAFLNDSRLGVSPRSIAPLSQSIIGCEYGNERNPEILNPKLASFSRVINAPVRAIRSVGSAAMNLCLIASGRLDAYFEAGIHCWDIAAGIVIVR